MDTSQTLASMVAQAKTPRASSPGRPVVMQGGLSGGGGFGKRKGVSASANIDLSGILKLFGVGPEAKKMRDEIINKGFMVYTKQGASNDPKVLEMREKGLLNPATQKILKEGYEEANPLVTMRYIEDPHEPNPERKAKYLAGGLPDLTTPEYTKPSGRVVYGYAKVMPSREDQREALLYERAPEDKWIEGMTEADRSAILAGGAGTKARKDLIGAEAYLRGSSAGGAGAQPKDALADDDKIWANLFRTATEPADLAPDDANVNYTANNILASGIMDYISNSQAKLNDDFEAGERALGKIKAWRVRVGKEQARKYETELGQVKHLARLKHYNEDFHNMLKAVKLDNKKFIGIYADYMDMKYKLSGDLGETFASIADLGFDAKLMNSLIDASTLCKEAIVSGDTPEVIEKKDEGGITNWITGLFSSKGEAEKVEETKPSKQVKRAPLTKVEPKVETQRKEKEKEEEAAWYTPSKIIDTIDAKLHPEASLTIKPKATNYLKTLLDVEELKYLEMLKKKGYGYIPRLKVVLKKEEFAKWERLNK